MGTTPRGLPYPESTDLVADGAAAIEALATATDTELNDATNDALTQANAYTDTTTAGIQDAAVDQAVAEAKTYTDTTTAGIQDAAVDQAVAEAKTYTDTTTATAADAAQAAAVAEANAYTDTTIAGITPGEAAATAVTGKAAYVRTDATGLVTITPTPPETGTWKLVTVIAAPATNGTDFYIPYLRRALSSTGTADFIVYTNGTPDPGSKSVAITALALWARQEA